MRRRFGPVRGVVLGAAIAIVCVGYGALMSLSVFLLPIVEATAWNRGAISTVALLNWLALGVGSIFWGTLSDRLGARGIAALGGFMMGLGMIVSSQVTSLSWFYVTFGVLVGFAVGAFYVPLNATIAGWFGPNRGLALALLSAGLGLGVFLAAPFTRWLIGLFGWRAAMLIVGDVVWLTIIPAALLLRERASVADSPSGDATQREQKLAALSIISNPRFWALAIAHFACCAAHSGPMFHMAAHVADQGIGRMTAATIFGVSGLASIAGRLTCGALADKIGGKIVLVAGLGLQATMIAMFLIVRDLGPLYAVGVIFGIAYGGVMPLYALLTREYFGEKAMGMAFGGVFMISCLGMGLGSFSGGWIYDRLGSYAWLHGASFVVGAAAAAVALMCLARRGDLTTRAFKDIVAPNDTALKNA